MGIFACASSTDERLSRPEALLDAREVFDVLRVESRLFRLPEEALGAVCEELFRR
jgi:hypothetical protein